MHIKKVFETKDFNDLESDIEILMESVISKLKLKLVNVDGEDDDFEWYDAEARSYFKEINNNEINPFYTSISYIFKMPLIDHTIQREHIKLTVKDMKFAINLLSELEKVMERVPAMGYRCHPLSYTREGVDVLQLVFGLDVKDKSPGIKGRSRNRL